MNRNATETMVGGLMLGVAALFFAATYSGERLAPATGYTLTAAFNRVDGLADGDEVRLSGIRVGQVEGQHLDEFFRAVLTLRIDGGIDLPLDSSAAIHTDGLFGSKFVVLDPGGDPEVMKDGDEIQYTQDAVIVQDLLDLIISEGRANRANARPADSKGDQP